MKINQFITPSRVRCLDCQNKQIALTRLSKLIAQDLPNVSADQVFEALNAREQLGSTGLGQGIAIPHARIPGLLHPVAAIIRLKRSIYFAAADNQSVDILFGLVVSEEAADQHLDLLAEIAQLFSEDKLADCLRQADSDIEAYNCLQKSRAK